MLKQLWLSLRRAVAGRRLGEALERNERAADDLDALLREVIRR